MYQYMVIQYIILEFTPLYCSHFSSSSPDSWNISTVIIFAFTYMCTHLFAGYSLSFPHYLPPPTGSSSPLLGRTCSAHLFFGFGEEKRQNIK
jgi:hypothetical protein